MNLFKKSFGLLAGGAATLMLAVGATAAADPVITPDPMINYASPGFNWDGFYAGAGIGGAALTDGTYATRTLDLQAVGGYNYTASDFLIGIKGAIGPYWSAAGGRDVVVSGELRGGVLITPQTLLYGSAGARYYLRGAALYGFVGAGAEFAVTDNISMDFEYRYLGWSNNTWSGHRASFATLWHFN